MSALLKIDLELDLRAVPMVGRFVTADGTAVAFTGWTGLVAALDGLAEAARIAPPTPPEEDHHVP